MQGRTLALLAVAAAALAGCGGGSGGGDRLTADEWVTQADAICKEASEQIDALGEPTDLAELAQLGGQALVIVEDQTAELKALVPPEELEAQVDRAMSLLDQQAELTRQLVAAAAAGDEAGVEALVAEIEPVEAEADQLAVELGLEECGGDS